MIQDKASCCILNKFKFFKYHRLMQIGIKNFHIKDFITFNPDFLKCLNYFFFDIKTWKAKVFKSFSKIFWFFSNYFSIIVDSHLHCSLMSFKHHHSEVGYVFFFLFRGKLKNFWVHIIIFYFCFFQVFIKDDFIHCTHIIVIYFNN